LHLQNSASTPIKDLVNIVIPKGDKPCHTKWMTKSLTL
jgi:hypothetical protein